MISQPLAPGDPGQRWSQHTPYAPPRNPRLRIFLKPRRQATPFARTVSSLTKKPAPAVTGRTELVRGLRNELGAVLASPVPEL